MRYFVCKETTSIFELRFDADTVLTNAEEAFSASKETEKSLCRSQSGGSESLLCVDPRVYGDVKIEQQARRIWDV